MGFWGFDSFIGDKRTLDELLEEKEEILEAILDKHRDWKEMQAGLPETQRRIAQVQEKIRRKNSHE